MKKVVFLCVVIAAFSMMYMYAGKTAAQEHRGPKLEVKQDSYNFGKIIQGREAVHVFEIRNIGDEPLVIDRVQPS